MIGDNCYEIQKSIGIDFPEIGKTPDTEPESAYPYYYDAVNWAYENGVTSGISETSFGPEENCTRGQVVTFLYRVYEK